MASTVLYLGNFPATGSGSYQGATFDDSVLQLVSVDGIDSGGTDGTTNWSYDLGSGAVSSQQSETAFFENNTVTYGDGSIANGNFQIVQLSNGDTFVTDNQVDGFDSILDNDVIASFTVSTNPLFFGGFGPSTISGASIFCFCRDTMIDTDQGEVAVQDLDVGMMVRTRDNGMQPIRWVGMTPARDRAVRIKAGAMGNTRDLVVSPRHRMVLDGWQLEMLFDHDEALVTALELVNDDTIVRDDMAAVEYYHVMFDKHEIIFAEGSATESFHPDQPSMGSMDAAAREEIFALFPELRDGAAREEAAPNLSATQAAYVGKNLDAFVN